MTKKDQRSIVAGLLQTTRAHMMQGIDDGVVPAEWSGHELRVWFADYAERLAEGTLIRSEPRSARARSYRDTVSTSNL